MPEPITIKTIDGWHVRQDSNHYNCGPNIIQIGFTVIECPRLKRFDRRYYRAEARKRDKAGLSHDERTWWVDGLPCTSLEEAVERLNKPIEFTEFESEVLAQIPTEFTSLRALEAKIAGIEPDQGGTIEAGSPLSKVFDAMHFLKAKGAVELGRAPLVLEDQQPGRRTIPTIRRKA